MISAKFHLTILSMLISVAGLMAQNLDIAPRPIKTPSPTFFGRVITSDAYVSVNLDIDKKGNVTNAIVRRSSHPSLEKPTLKAVRKWEFEPAYRNGTPVACKIVQPLTLGSNMLTSVDTKAIPLYSPKPEISRNRQDVEGEVGVAVSIDSAGFVTRVKVLYSTDQRLNLPVLKAIRKWQYEPAKRMGRSVSSKQIQPFVFNENTKYVDDQVQDAAATSITVNPIRPTTSKHLTQLDSDDG